jgi:serine/threonine protein kinase/Tfp pilus assembly protein PilF/TolB-like protein
MPPAPGMRFGRYELLKPLGAGGMGEVYRARDRDLGRDVAVKFLSARFAADADRLARFAFEARTASSLNHPNIVTIHEIGEAEGLPYIVMELVEGETLRAAIRDGRLPTRRVLDIASQIADGLAKAHSAGIVHRDLKPENVMLTPDGFVKILDFGLAKLHADVIPGGTPHDRGQTETPTTFPTGTRDGAIIGTAGYMSPEQAAGRPADFRADQFAFGATLYEMATGRQAFQRDSVVQTLNAIIEHDPLPLAELNPSFPAPARWIAERCLAKAPGDRYASTLDLARELRGVREHLSEASNSSAEPRPVPAPGRVPVPRRRLRAWHLVTAAAVLLASLLAVPTIRDGVLERLHLLPIPSDMSIAVLPVECLVTTAEEKAACAGLLDSVTSRLGALQRYRLGLIVVPAQEVRQSDAKKAVDALRRLNATLAVHVTVRRTGPSTAVAAVLVDARSGRELRAAERSFVTRQASLVDETVDAVVGMLDMELNPREQTALTAGSPRDPLASWLYLEAVGRTPYQLGQTALERADQQPSVDAAIKLFNKALELEPGYALAHAGLGRAYLSLYQIQNRPEYAELAEEHCNRANELDRLMPQAWLTLGSLHTQLRQFDQALEDLNRAHDRDPANEVVYARIAFVYQQQRRDSEAEQAYLKAISLAQKSWWPHAYYGAFLALRERYPEAEQQFRIAHEIAPDNPRILSNLGGVLWNRQRQAEARVAFEKSIQLYPTSGALSNYATLEFGDKRFAEAAAIYRRAAQLAPRDYRIWRNMALAYSHLDGGQAGVEARDAFRTALGLAEQERQRDPKNGMLAAQLADCHAKLGNETEARRVLAEVEQQAPGGSETKNTMKLAAEVYEDLGDRDASLRMVEAGFARGLTREEVEQAATFDKLRVDPRYQSLVARLASGKKK